MKMMMRKIVFLAAFALLLGRSECTLSDVEITQEDLEEIELEHLEPDTCPGTEGCFNKCPMGRLRDDEGCFICDCEKTGKFEGDILVSDADYWRLLERYDKSAPMSPDRRKRGALSLAQSEWKRVGDNIEIPYVLSSTITGFKRQRIMEAIEEYRSRTCLRWVERKKESDYVEFVGTGGCSSHVGKIGGRQTISIGRNCESRLGTVVHEMMHAIGFWHEQSRGDRDFHVTVRWQNIIPRAKANFKKQERFWNNYGSPYDAHSVMHYGGDFFSASGSPTIVDKKTGAMIEAQRDNFSPEDVRQINRKYKCTNYLTNDRPADISYAAAPTCKDQLAGDSCKKYSDRGYCKYSNFKTKCELTCGECKASATTAVGGTKTVTSVLTVEKNEECKDTSKSCAKLVAKGFCTKSKKTMASFCKKSCDLCGGVPSGSSCKDKSSKCERWANAGYCEKASHKRYLSKACMKSCGVCVSDQPLPEAFMDMVVKE